MSESELLQLKMRNRDLCDEIEALETKLDHYRMAAEAESQEVDKLNAELDEYKGHCKALFENLNDATSRLGKALEFIRDSADDTYTEGSRWQEANRLLKEIDGESHRSNNE